MHLGERFAFGEPKAAWVPLNLFPLFQFVEVAQLSSGPATKVGFEKPALNGHFVPKRGGYWCCRFSGAFHRRGIDGFDPFGAQFGDAGASLLGLFDAEFGQMKTFGSARQNLAGGWSLAVANEQDDSWLLAGLYSGGLWLLFGLAWHQCKPYLPSVDVTRSPDLTSPDNDSLEQVASDVASCRACPRLVEWRETVGVEKRAAYRDWTYWSKGVPAFGGSPAKLAVIGLAPAAHGANRTGRMFTGDRSGDWLYRALHRAGFANQPTSTDVDDGLILENTIVTSPVKCAPPANKPTSVERDTCRPFLDRELALVQPEVYIALGGFAFQALCSYFEIRPRPKFGHGVEVALPATDNRAEAVILCSYHVSQQNTFTGRLTEQMLDDVFGRARDLLS